MLIKILKINYLPFFKARGGRSGFFLTLVTGNVYIVVNIYKHF